MPNTPTRNADALRTELLDSLSKMAPTKEKERKLKKHIDDTSIKLGHAEKFLKADLNVPFDTYPDHLKHLSGNLFDVRFFLVIQLSHLRIEESLKAHDSDKGKGKEVGGPYVNMTEESKNKHNKQNKGKKRSNENNSGSGSNKKPKLESWKCGKTGHFKRDWRSGKKNNTNAGDSGKGSKDQSQDQDSGATTHVCKDRCWFNTFEPVEDRYVLYIGDEHFAPIHGEGSVALEFSSKKTVTLFNVLYVPKLCKNLVSGHVLNKCGYIQDMTTNFGNLDKFEGNNFRRWQKKMHFLLTTLKVVYVLTTPMPELVEDATVEVIRIRAKWENDDYICRGYILNGMSDSLFDVYTNVESAKELWDSLESKYMAEDSSSKKFLVSNFNTYKMVDSRPVMEQYNELLRILRQYIQYGLKMNESIYVLSIIDKLPPFWNDFKHTLKHGKDDLSLVQLGSHLGIEKYLRAQDSNKRNGKEVGEPSINMREEVVIRRTQMLVVREKGLRTIPKTKVDAIAWWFDSGATTHVCKDRYWFKTYEPTYEPVEDGSVLYMSDNHFAPVYEKGSVVLEFSSGKSITSGVFVGFGYYNNGMFMLNLNKVPDDSDYVYMTSSM
nr:zinc finger, CCHC-type [Tanacetum cinerariifolium]